MKPNEKYWTYYKHPKTKYTQILQAIWQGSFIDNQRLIKKRIYKTKDEAERAANK